MSAGTKDCDCGGKTELMSDFRLAGSPLHYTKGPFKWHVVCLSCKMSFTCNLTSMFKTKERWNRMRGGDMIEKIDLAEKVVSEYKSIYLRTGYEPLFDIMNRKCHEQLKFNLIIALGNLMRG